MLVSSSKKEIINDFANNANDTGSVEIQCALFTERVKILTKHLQEHKKDFSSRRGLIMIISQRRKLLNYLKLSDYQRYLAIIKKLGLKK